MTTQDDEDDEADDESWRGELDAEAAGPDIIDVTAPLLMLEPGASHDDMLRVLREVADRMKEAPRSTRSAARDVLVSHLKRVLGVKSPARIVDDVLRESKPTDEDRAKCADRLVGIARESCELFHDGDGIGYARVKFERHHENHGLRSPTYKRWLVSRYFDDTEEAPYAQSVTDAIGVLEGFAFRDGATHKVHVRFARSDDGAAYVDLGDPDWSCIEIKRGAWAITKDPPVRFRRPRGLRPLPMPQRGSSIDALFAPHAVEPDPNLPDDDRPPIRLLPVKLVDQILLLAWLVSVLLCTAPYAIVALLGRQGSGKSTIARVLRALLDPVKAPLRSPPKDERDLVIAANASGIVAFDNISRLSERLSDALCRLSTGAGFGTRELYADAEEFLFEGVRPVLLTGITRFIQRPDLMDRAVVIEVPTLGEDRATESDFNALLDNLHARLLGALLDVAAAALARMDDARRVLGRTHLRMADFAQVGVAVDLALGGNGQSFLDRYGESVAAATGELLDTDVVAPLVVELLRNRRDWSGSAGELLDELKRLAPEGSTLPRTPRGLTSSLDRLGQLLERNGIEFKRETRGVHRSLRLVRRSDSAEHASEAAPQSDATNARPGAGHAPPRASGRGATGSGEREPCAECGFLDPNEGIRSGCSTCEASAPEGEWGSL